MRVHRSVISNKGLVTLPKEWREQYNLDQNSEVEIIFKRGGPLMILPTGFIPDALQEACLSFLEKGLTREQMSEAYNVAENLTSNLRESLLDFSK